MTVSRAFMVSSYVNISGFWHLSSWRSAFCGVVSLRSPIASRVLDRCTSAPWSLAASELTALDIAGRAEAEAAIALLMPCFVADSAGTVVRAPAPCDGPADPAAAQRKLIQKISWDASTLATDSIHSQRDPVSGPVAEPAGSASITSAASCRAAAASAVASAAEECSRPLKKRRTALSPPSPCDQVCSPEGVSCSASADGALGESSSPHEHPEQSDEDSVEPKLSAMELMHGQWAGRAPHPARNQPCARPIATPFPGHHSVNCMHPEGDLVSRHALPQMPSLQVYLFCMSSSFPCCAVYVAVYVTVQTCRH